MKMAGPMKLLQNAAGVPHRTGQRLDTGKTGQVPTGLPTVRVQWLDLGSETLEFVTAAASNGPFQVGRQAAGDVLSSVLARVS